MWENKTSDKDEILALSLCSSVKKTVRFWKFTNSQLSDAYFLPKAPPLRHFTWTPRKFWAFCMISMFCWCLEGRIRKQLTLTKDPVRKARTASPMVWPTGQRPLRSLWMDSGEKNFSLQCLHGFPPLISFGYSEACLCFSGFSSGAEIHLVEVHS